MWIPRIYVFGVSVLPSKGHRFHILVWLATTMLDMADTAHAHHWCPAALESNVPDGTLFVLFPPPQARLALEHRSTCQRAPVYPKLSSFLFLTVYEFHLYPSLTITEINTEDYRTWSLQCVLNMQEADLSYSSFTGLCERLCDNMNSSLSSCLTLVLSLSAHIPSRYAEILGKHMQPVPAPTTLTLQHSLGFWKWAPSRQGHLVEPSPVSNNKNRG